QIAGSDLFPAFCDFHRDNTKNIKIYLLGGTAITAELARKNLNLKTGAEIVVGAYSPPFGFETDQEETSKIIKMVNSSNATVLALGVGAPKQEKWIFNNKEKFTKVRIFFAVGATINFEAKTLDRAPVWMKKIGMEWLFRMLKEPRLIKRYFINDVPIFWWI